MKTKTYHPTIAWAAIAFVVSAGSTAFAQNTAGSSAEFVLQTAAERPRTAAERTQDLQAQHNQAFSELSVTLNRLPQDPDFLGTKELFAEIDKTDRDMKRIRGGCTSLMASVRAEHKTISASSAFTEEQKQELTEAADSLAQGCEDLANKLDHAIERLGGAYQILPKWNRIYKSYRNLQGQEKAARQVKIQVDDYLASFTPKPTADSGGESQKEASSGDAR